MTARFNLEAETGEIIPFPDARSLLEFVEERMQREAEEDDGE